MSNRTERGILAATLGCSLLVCTSAYAQGALAPMSGTGGVIRDAERRVLAPERPSSKDVAAPEIKAKRSAPTL